MNCDATAFWGWTSSAVHENVAFRQDESRGYDFFFLYERKNLLLGIGRIHNWFWMRNRVRVEKGKKIVEILN